jgi:HEAT repeat protein
VSDEVADDVVRRVAATVRVQTLDEVLAAVASPPRSAGTVNRLGIAGPDAADERVVTALAGALADPDPAVRRAAANAAGLLSWPELADPLRAAIAVEMDDDVRRMAERALDLTTE